MKTTTVSCAHCGKEFDRCAAEVKRSERLGRKHYCSRACCGKDNNDHLLRTDEFGNLSPDNKLDQYSPFRDHLKKARMHSTKRPKDFSITLEDLKSQWEKQQGRCPYTDWELENPPTTGHKTQLHPARASLDRIDSARGYTADNIQFVAYMANCAKNSFPEEKLFEFCQAVAAMRK
jgi:hypothetical protein